MKLSKWKLMALIIPAAWTSISYAYDWNDDVTQRVQTLIGNAADKYVQGDYDSYNSDTETAINLLLTIEPQPQSPEQIDARKIQAAQLVDETVKKEIISLEQSLEANQAKADAEYQKMQSMSKEEKEQAAAKAAAEKALAAKANRHSRISVFKCESITFPKVTNSTDASEEFQNQLMPKWAHSRNKEEAFQFAVTRITSS
ncbi:TPA: hypothetical protein ACW5DF_001433 [Salmonella enterica subsp. enterica serovar Schwarzengrund]